MDTYISYNKRETGVGLGGFGQSKHGLMRLECGRLELHPTKSPMRGLNANFAGPNCNHLLLTTILSQRKIGSIVQ